MKKNIKVSDTLHKQLKIKASRNGLSLEQLTQKLLRKALHEQL